MKRLFAGITILIFILSLCSCGKKEADDPITKITLGMTLEQAKDAEPTLTEYEGKGYSCSKNYAHAKGTLLISLPPESSGNEESTVSSILWQTDPTDGKGKAVYDTLFSDLKKAYGAPKSSQDKKDLKTATGIYDQAQALWEFDDFKVSCNYIKYHESGKCQILYSKGIIVDSPF